MSGIMSMVLGAKTAIAAAVDAYFNLVTLLLPGDGTNGAQNNTFIDSSTNNFTITRNGNTTQGTFSPFSQTGWSNYFNGSTDSIYTPSNAALGFGTGDFTVEFWIYPISIASKSLYHGSATNSLVINTDASGKFIVRQYGVADLFTSSAALSTNAWNHVAVSRSGTTISAWLNGSRANGFTGTNSTNWATTAVYIGAADTAANYVNAYFSNVRVVKGTDVYGVSNSTITVPTSPLTAITNTSLLTCQDNRFRDASSNAFAITVNSSPSVQAFSPFAPTAAYSAATNGGSGYFDGTGDYLTLPSSSNLAVGTGDFCIEGWVYFTSSPTSAMLITNISSNDTQLAFRIDASNYPKLQGWNTNFVVSNTTVGQNQWYHLVCCRVSNSTSIFINGTRTANATVTNNFSSTNAFTVGGQSSDLPGYISGLRLIKGSSPYDPTQTSITVPTAPPTAITNTQLLLNFTNAGITDATAKNVLETVGNAQISTTQSKFGGSSMYFDGIGDRLVGPSTQNTAFRTGDFTIEFWAYPTSSTSTFRSFIDTRSGSVNTGISIWQNGTSLEIYGSAQQLAATSALTVNAWQHIAVTRASNTVRAFVNGTQVGSSYTNSNDMTDTRLVIADDNTSTYPFVGYLDDFRITKGYARYTANFTAPTAAFPLQ